MHRSLVWARPVPHPSCSLKGTQLPQGGNFPQSPRGQPRHKAPTPGPPPERALGGARGPFGGADSTARGQPAGGPGSTPARPGDSQRDRLHRPAPCALTAFVSPYPACTQPATHRCPRGLLRFTRDPPRLRKPGSPGRTPSLPHSQTWHARRPRRPRPVGRQAKPGAAAARWLPRGGAARRTEHAHWARPALGARRKRSLLWSRRLRWGMRYLLAWLLHPASPSTFRSALGARLSPPERLCG